MHVFREPQQWARGLIGFTSEQAKDGALFILYNTAPWPVMIDEVDFPLDVYWMSEAGIVLEHAELFPGQGVHYPDVAAKFVLELPMGEQPRYRVGDFVEVPHDAPADS